MLRLIMRRGPTPGATYDLAADEVNIGRGAKNHIIIQDNQVSRTHCKLVRLQTDYEVQDQDSVSGTFVNGQRVSTSLRLQPGMLIELGDSITLEYATDQLHNGSAPPLGLLMLRGPAEGYRYALDDDMISIGRDLDNHIVIQDAEVSRFHVRLTRTRRGYTVEDLSSTNGTFVNEEALTFPRDLELNDVIKLGTQVQLQCVLHQDTSNNDEASLRRAINAEPREDTLYDFLGRTLAQAANAPRGSLPSAPAGALRDHALMVYAREDWHGLVAPLLINLQDAGVKTWVDQHLTNGSDAWGAEVEQALRECWLMIVVLTPSAIRAPHVRLLYRHFLAQEKPIIPVVYDATQTLPAELARLRPIIFDAREDSRVFHKLVYAIRQRRNGDK